jgi:hypothetical protein
MLKDKKIANEKLQGKNSFTSLQDLSKAIK